LYKIGGRRLGNLEKQWSRGEAENLTELIESKQQRDWKKHEYLDK
jgi:hypothetical protein